MTALRNRLGIAIFGYVIGVLFSVTASWSKPGGGDFCPVVCWSPPPSPGMRNADWVWTELPFGKERFLWWRADRGDRP